MKLGAVALCLGVLLAASEGDKINAESWHVENPSVPKFMDSLKLALKNGRPPKNPPAAPVHRIESVKTLNGIGKLRYKMTYVTRLVKHDLTRCTIEFHRVWGPRLWVILLVKDPHPIDHISCDYIARIPF